MSYWAYITGIIKINARGRTQPEKRYILDTVLEHLPTVTGSEQDMEYYVVQKMGYNSSSTDDEFHNRTNLAKINGYGGVKYDRLRGWFKNQDTYFIVVDGNFRDREFEETFKEFNKWINRLAKRVWIKDVIVKLQGYDKEYVFTNKNDVYSEMYDFDNNWTDYLVWKYEDD